MRNLNLVLSLLGPTYLGKCKTKTFARRKTAIVAKEMQPKAINEENKDSCFTPSIKTVLRRVKVCVLHLPEQVEPGRDQTSVPPPSQDPLSLRPPCETHSLYLSLLYITKFESSLFNMIKST